MLVKASGQSNYNSCLILEYGRKLKPRISKEYSLRNHFYRIGANTAHYFSPSDKYYFIREPRQKIQTYAEIFNYLTLSLPLTPRNHLRILPFIILVLSFILFIYRRIHLVGVSLGIIIVHFLTHALTDGGEGARFVYDIEFIFYILFSVLYLNLKKIIKSILILRKDRSLLNHEW